MAGRKPPSTPDILSMLLGKIGLARAPKKGKKGKRRKMADPAAGLRPGTRTQESPPGLDPMSPFAQYGATAGLMGPEEDHPHPGTMSFDAPGYEAAAAAGFAPPMPAGFDAGISASASNAASATPNLPRFGVDAPAPAALAPGRLFSEEGLDNSLDALFSGLETGLNPPPLLPSEPATERERLSPLFDAFGLTPPVPIAPGANEATPIDPDASVRRRETPPPPIIPVPQAATNTAPTVPPLASHAGVTPGMLLATADANRLPAATVLTLAEGQDLRALLAAIDRTPGVAGTLLVGYDGLLILTSMPASTGTDGATTIDRDFLGAQACNLFSGNRVQLEKIQRGELRRIILETASGAMLMTAADMGILVVVSHEGQAMDIPAVMAAIAGVLGTA